MGIFYMTHVPRCIIKISEYFSMSLKVSKPWLTILQLKKDDLKSIKDELDNVKVFGSPPQTLDWWATEVQKEWDGLDTTITTEAQSAQTGQ